jgi:hypothetical protein
MSIKDFARIEFLQSGFGNDVGEIAKVVHETEGEVYYYDGFRRYCYMNKSEEGVNYRYIPKGVRANTACTGRGLQPPAKQVNPPQRL